MARIQSKVCQCCRKPLPFAAGAFDEDATSPDGYADVCKDCISTSVTTMIRNRALETSALADEQIRGRLNQELLNAGPVSHDGDFVPHISSMFDAIMRQFGGVHGFAANLVSTYTCTQPDSHTRAKILADILKLGGAVTAEGRSKSIDQMSDEELKLANERIQRKMAISMAQDTQLTHSIPLPGAEDSHGKDATDEHEVSDRGASEEVSGTLGERTPGHAGVGSGSGQAGA
jgi:hypothetical protein